MKILLADPSEVWCDALEDQLKSHYTVLRCADGRDVLPMLIEHQPNLLVLNLEQPYIDGLSLLHLIRTAGVQVRVLAVSTLFTEYALGMLSEFKISHMLLKPCTVCSALSQIYQILHYEENADNLSKPDPVLLALGMRMDLCGYECVREAIMLLRKNPGQGISKILYPEVAGICGGTPQRVERAIRNVIRDAWLHRDERIWRIYFTADQMQKRRQPSNGEFITRIALCGNNNRACG